MKKPTTNLMKISNVIAYALLLLMLIACESQKEKKLGNFELLPSVQELSIMGVSDLKYDGITTYFSPTNKTAPIFGEILAKTKHTDNQEDAQLIFAIDTLLDIRAEGYTLKIEQEQVHITGKDNAGLFYGLKTLEQLVEDAKEQNVNLPICTIKDFPLLAYRAIHLDVKHHREKIEYYYQLIDKLASYKINGIIIEFEDKIKFKNQPKIASKDALSIGEWKKLADYAMEHYIEISPLMQGLGHSSFVLKHDEYKNLRDDPESDWAYNPLDPKTYEVQFDLYRDAMAATPHGKYLHVGGDEVHTTGRDSGKTSLELQLLWLNKVSEFAEEHGRTPIFWDDMPLQDAGVYGSMFNTKLTEAEVDKIWETNEHKLLKFLDQFPKNCIYMRWNYSSPQAIGNTKAMEWFRSHGMQVMGATAGQTRWVLMPQNESNIANIKSFAVSSIDKGLNGLLLTLWDDDSPHFELYMRGILAFAEYTWAGDQRSKEELKSVFRHREYANVLAEDAYAFIDKLERPAGQWKNILLKENQRNYLNRNENPKQLVIDIPDVEHPGDMDSKIS